MFHTRPWHLQFHQQGQKSGVVDLRKGTSSPRPLQCWVLSLGRVEPGDPRCRGGCPVEQPSLPPQFKSCCLLISQASGLITFARFPQEVLSRSNDFSCRKKGLEIVFLLFHVPNPFGVVWEKPLVCLEIVMFAILSPLGNSPRQR